MRPSRLKTTARDMREEFDRSFAHVPRPDSEPVESLLAIRVAGLAFAVTLSEVVEMRADASIVPLPTPVPDLLGVASVRSHLAPVFDLGAVLGFARAQAPRWLILARGAAPVAFAFENFEGHFTAARTALAQARAVEGPGGIRSLIQLSAVLEQVQRRVAASRVKPEQRS